MVANSKCAKTKICIGSLKFFLIFRFFSHLVGHCLLYSYRAIPAAIDTFKE